MLEAVVTIEDVTRNGDWFNIQTEELGRISTKRKALATEAKEFKGGRARIEYNEKEVSNERGDFTNRYLEKVLGPASSNGVAGPVSTKDMQIMRQTASKVAAFLAPHLPEEERTPEGLVQLAEFWLDYYINGVNVDDLPPADPDDDIPW